MSYSYRCSQLNWTIYNCSVIKTLLLQCYPHIQSPNDISLAYSSSKPSGLRTAKHLTKCFTLSYFRSLFNDHRRPFCTLYNTKLLCANYFNNVKNLVNVSQTYVLLRILRLYYSHIRISSAIFIKIRNLFQTTKYFFKDSQFCFLVKPINYFIFESS